LDAGKQVSIQAGVASRAVVMRLTAATLTCDTVHDRVQRSSPWTFNSEAALGSEV